MTTPRNTPKTGTWAEVLADSVAPGCPRLTSLKVRFPHIILPQVLTHRVFSRNTSSSRAIPVARLIADVERDPFIPREWRYSADRGMQPGEVMSKHDSRLALFCWKNAMERAMIEAGALAVIGASKEHSNRALEPYAHVSMIITATEWGNFLKLRLDSHSQIEIRDLAEAIRDAMAASAPKAVRVGDWHMPYGDSNDRMQSAACCARISYDSHDGGKATPKANLRLADGLMADGHWSPFEHQCCAGINPAHRGNFAGNWMQQRKIMEANE
jgi:thymidylate synthase ThyX